MALKNQARTAWVVAGLDVQPTDQVLEIGFGPGNALQQVAALAPRGFVAGLDISAAMVQQARWRNAGAIQRGQMDVRQGGVDQMPYPAGRFDKAFAINCYRFWPQPEAGLVTLRRVLKPGGRLTLAEQPMHAADAAEVAALQEALRTQLAAAGFRHLQTAAKPLQPAPVVAVSGEA